MKVAVFYTGTSLLAPLREAEREINRQYKLGLRVAAYNFGSPLDHKTWTDVEQDLRDADIVFIIHVMDGENATRLLASLACHDQATVIVINCMPELMRRTRMGRLDASRLLLAKTRRRGDTETGRRGDTETRRRGDTETRRRRDTGTWVPALQCRRIVDWETGSRTARPQITKQRQIRKAWAWAISKTHRQAPGHSQVRSGRGHAARR